MAEARWRCDRCSEYTALGALNSVRVILNRDGKEFISRWCPQCAVVLWDQLAELSTFHEQKVTQLNGTDLEELLSRSLALAAHHSGETLPPGIERVIAPHTELRMRTTNRCRTCGGSVPTRGCPTCQEAP